MAAALVWPSCLPGTWPGPMANSGSRAIPTSGWRRYGSQWRRARTKSSRPGCTSSTSTPSMRRTALRYDRTMASSWWVRYRPLGVGNGWATVAISSNIGITGWPGRA